MTIDERALLKAADMCTDAISELQSFQQFIGDIVTQGATDASPEDALDQWRAMHPRDDDLIAVREAIDDMNAGDSGVPLDEFDQQFRNRHNLPSQS